MQEATVNEPKWTLVLCFPLMLSREGGGGLYLSSVFSHFSIFFSPSLFDVYCLNLFLRSLEPGLPLSHLIKVNARSIIFISFPLKSVNDFTCSSISCFIDEPCVCVCVWECVSYLYQPRHEWDRDCALYSICYCKCHPGVHPASHWAHTQRQTTTHTHTHTDG